MTTDFDGAVVRFGDPRLKAPNVDIIDINSFMPRQKYLAFGYDENNDPIYHQILQISVNTRLRILAMQKEAERDGSTKEDADEEVQQRYAIEMIHCMVPSLSREALAETPYTALMPILQYCLQVMVQQGDEVLEKAKNVLNRAEAEAEAQAAG
jgi:hypothetical protein